MKRKSTESDISSYFKKKVSAGEREPSWEPQQSSSRGEHPPLSEEEDTEEQAEAEHDENTQAQTGSGREHSEDEEHQGAADQEQEETMVTEAGQDSAKAGVRPVPGPPGDVMTVTK